MENRPPPRSRKPPIDEYHPIEMPREETPRKKGGSLVLIFLAFILILVLAGLIILIFKPSLINRLSEIQIAKIFKSESTPSVQEENISPQAKESITPPTLSNEERIVEVENELVDLRKCNENLTSQIKEQEKEISSLNFRIKQTREEKSNAENEMKKLKGQIEQNKVYYENQINKLKDEAEQEREQLLSEIAELSKELNETKRIMKATEETYKRRADRETAAVEEILSDAKRAQQRVQQVEEARRNLEEENKELKSRIAELEKKISEVKEGDLVPLTSDVQQPEVLKSHSPRYPIWARRRSIKGEVSLRVLISATGQVMDAEVMKCSQPGYGLEGAALDAIKKWEFTPAMKDGKKVKVWMNITMNFKP